MECGSLRTRLVLAVCSRAPLTASPHSTRMHGRGAPGDRAAVAAAVRARREAAAGGSSSDGMHTQLTLQDDSSSSDDDVDLQLEPHTQAGPVHSHSHASSSVMPVAPHSQAERPAATQLGSHQAQSQQLSELSDTEWEDTMERTHVQQRSPRAQLDGQSHVDDEFSVDDDSRLYAAPPAAAAHAQQTQPLDEDDAEEMFAHFNRSHSLPLAATPAQSTSHVQHAQPQQPLSSSAYQRQSSMPAPRASSRERADRIEEEQEEEEEAYDDDVDITVQRQQPQQQHSTLQQTSQPQGVSRHPMEVVYPEDEEDEREQAGQQWQQQQQQQQQHQPHHILAQQQQQQQQQQRPPVPQRPLSVQQRQQLQQAQAAQPRASPQLQRTHSAPQHKREEVQLHYEQQRALLLQEQHAQRELLQQQQRAEQLRQQEMLAQAEARQASRLPQAHLLAQRQELRQYHQFEQQSMHERDQEVEQQQRLERSVAAAAASSSSSSPAASFHSSSPSHSQSHSRSTLRPLAAPLPGQDRLDEIARRLQIMEERKAQSSRQLGGGDGGSGSAAASTADMTMQDTPVASAAATTGGVLSQRDTRGQLYDALRKIERMRGARGRSALLSHSQLAHSAAQAAKNNTRPIVDVGRGAYRGRSPLVSPEEVPSFLGANSSSRSTREISALLPSRPAAPSDPSHHLADLSLSAILSHSTGGGAYPGAVDDVPPLVAAALLESAATRKRLEELQLQQVSLNQSQQALGASVRHLAEMSGVGAMGTMSLSSSSFTSSGAPTAAAAARRNAPEASFHKSASAFPPPPRSAPPASDLPVTPPQPSFFLYSSSEEDAQAERMQAAQLAMAQQQLQRQQLIAQQDAVLQQQQQLLLHNAAQIGQSMAASQGMATTLAANGDVPVMSPSHLHAQPLQPHRSPPPSYKIHPAEPPPLQASPSARALQHQLDSTARVWDEVDEILAGPAAQFQTQQQQQQLSPPPTVKRQPMVSPPPQRATVSNSSVDTTAQRPTVTGGQLDTNERSVSVQAGQGHAITVNVHPVINVMGSPHATYSLPPPPPPPPAQPMHLMMPPTSLQDHHTASSHALEQQKARFMSQVAPIMDSLHYDAAPHEQRHSTRPFDAASELAKYNYHMGSLHQSSSSSASAVPHVPATAPPFSLAASAASHLSRNSFASPSVAAAAPSGAHYLDHLLGQKAALFAHLHGLEHTEALERQRERAAFEAQMRRIEEQARESKQQAEWERRREQRRDIYTSLQQRHEEQEEQWQRQQRKLTHDFDEEKEQMAFQPQPAYSAAPSHVSSVRLAPMSPAAGALSPPRHADGPTPRFSSSIPMYPVLGGSTSAMGTPSSSPRMRSSHQFDPRADMEASAEEAAARARTQAAKKHIAEMEAAEGARRMEAARARAEEDAEFEEEMRQERARVQAKWRAAQEEAEAHARNVIAAQVREETTARQEALKQQRERMEAEAAARQLQKEREELADAERSRAVREREEYLARLRREREEFAEQERLAQERALRQREEALQNMRHERIAAEIEMQREVERRMAQEVEEQERHEQAQEEAKRQRQEHEDAMRRTEELHQRTLKVAAMAHSDAHAAAASHGADIAAGGDSAPATERQISERSEHERYIFDRANEAAAAGQISARSTRSQAQDALLTTRTTAPTAADESLDTQRSHAAAQSHWHDDDGLNTQRSDYIANELEAAAAAEAAAEAVEAASAAEQYARTPPDSPKQLTHRAEQAAAFQLQQPQDDLDSHRSAEHVQEEQHTQPQQTLTREPQVQVNSSERAGHAESSSLQSTAQHSKPSAVSVATMPVLAPPTVPAVGEVASVASFDPTSVAAAPASAPSAGLAAHRPPSLHTGPLRVANHAVPQPSPSPPLPLSRSPLADDDDGFAADEAEARAIEAALASPAHDEDEDDPNARRAMLSPSKMQQRQEQQMLSYDGAEGADGGALASPRSAAEDDSLDTSVDSMGFPKYKQVRPSADPDASVDSVSEAGDHASTRGGGKRTGGDAEGSYGGSSDNFDWLDTANDLAFGSAAHATPAPVSNDWQAQRAARWNTTPAAAVNPTTANATAAAVASTMGAHNTTPAPSSLSQPARPPTTAAAATSAPQTSRDFPLPSSRDYAYGTEDLHSDTGDADFDENYHELATHGEVSARAFTTDTPRETTTQPQQRVNEPAPQPAAYEEPNFDDSEFDRIAAEAEEATSWLD